MNKPPLLRAMMAFEIEGNQSMGIVVAIPLGDVFRIVARWGETMEGELIPVLYADVPTDSLQVINDPNEPFELCGFVPEDVPWIEPDSFDHSFGFIRSDLPPDCAYTSE